MTAILIIPAIALGIWASFFIIGYAMLALHNPLQRVYFLWSILAIEFAALCIATYLGFAIGAMVLFTFALTKCVIWITIINLRNVIHFNNTED